MRFFTAMPALLAFAFTLPLTAQDAAIAKIRSDAGFRAAAQKNFVAYEESLSSHCHDVNAAWGLAKPKVYGQPVTGKDGGLANATWVESVPGTACGQSRRFRVLVTIRGGRAGVAPLLPGDSIAAPQLERDAQAPLIAATASFAPKGERCAVDVVDTAMDGPAPTQPKQPWAEVWTVRTCNRRLAVPIRFVPDVVGEGTSIRIESKAVTVAP